MRLDCDNVWLTQEGRVRVLYISEVQWLSQVSRKHQMIRCFPRDWEIMFISPINSSANENSFREREERVPARVRYVSIPLPKPDSHIPPIRFLTRCLTAVGRRTVLRAVKTFNPDVVVCSYIWAAPFISDIQKMGVPVVYDCNDLHPQFYPCCREEAEEMFRMMASSVDEVIASSEHLRDECGRGHLIGNGVDLGTFKGKRETPIPEVIARSRLSDCEDLVVYVGSIDDRLDVGILRRILEVLTERRRRTGLVIVGRIFDSVRSEKTALERAFPDSVLFTGRVAYEELSFLMSPAVVGIAPFVMTPLTEAINPNKLYMYAAMDLNVVSTPFSDEIRRHEGDVYIASDPGEFASAVEKAIGDDERRRSIREKIALPNSWDRRAEEFTRVLSGLKRAG
jgi:glycosyltransferase involved in cell wall biosynthesis